ncbi:hypothetical protein SAMN02745857_02240 [Andreprevotia lacus DSM 23236]|jgi:hypothetical protein|uniref:DUF7931 domain-containing protein n=1 Tax=Andreprevotia lacus DSM 23236 TaxID=1121001 RepID=A0A1W1XPB0_9NEIS|nr:hypothetical protein [Andreprevotia lacus]SMC25692.1 hypothetical protein SAMN02745857_02240 [Andreprevotia lacus DSM 23236]
MNVTTTATFTWPADPPQRFDRYADYAASFSALLAVAQHSLWLYEDDFKAADLGGRANCEQLQRFLVGGGQLTVLARRPDYIAASAPRFLRLHDVFAHQMSLNLLREDAQTDEQVFSLADDRHYVIRHHLDWPRGEAGSNGAAVAFLQQKSQYLQDLSEPASAWRRLDI